MNKCLPVLFLLVFALLVSAETQRLYLAAGDEITVYSIDSKTGKLKQIQSVDLAGAGPFAFSHDGKLMYVMANDGKTPQLASLKRKKDGTLDLIRRESIKLRGGYLDVDASGRYIAAHHYGAGKLSLWKLSDGVYKGQLVQHLTLEPKVHCSVFTPDNRWLLVPATVPNKIFILSFDEKKGKLKPHDPPFAPGPQGENKARRPRHLLFNVNKPDVFYTTCENEQPGVGVWSWNAEKGIATPIQNIITKPKGFKETISTSALQMTPDGKFLYLCNRNVIDKKAKTGKSSVVGFRVNSSDGTLTLISHTPCEVTPRSLSIDRTGMFLYVAGTIDSRLGVYAIEQKPGKLRKVEQHTVGRRPAWVEAR